MNCGQGRAWEKCGCMETELGSLAHLPSTGTPDQYLVFVLRYATQRNPPRPQGNGQFPRWITQWNCYLPSDETRSPTPNRPAAHKDQAKPSKTSKHLRSNVNLEAVDRELMRKTGRVSYRVTGATAAGTATAT